MLISSATARTKTHTTAMLSAMCGIAQTTLAQEAVARVNEPALAEPEFQPLPNSEPLAITITPAPVPKGQMPEFVTMTLTNTADHEVLLPEPGIGCTDKADGTIELLVTPAAEVAACAVTPAAQPKWITLQPGETANFGQRVTLLLPPGAGTFEVRGQYTPPQLAPSMAEDLYSKSVTYPTEPLTSAAVTLIRE